jgi:hypothetical protein
MGAVAQPVEIQFHGTRATGQVVSAVSWVHVHPHHHTVGTEGKPTRTQVVLQNDLPQFCRPDVLSYAPAV